MATHSLIIMTLKTHIRKYHSTFSFLFLSVVVNTDKPTEAVTSIGTA